MLENIKKLINEKKEFMEAASIILEDAGMNLDDSIILGESTYTDDLPDEYLTEDGDTETTEVEEEETELGDVDTDMEEDDDTVDNLMNSSIEGGMDDDINPTNDTVAAQSPEVLDGQSDTSTEDIMNDIMGVSIDLRSNTLTDVLPVPPGNAIDAVADTDDTVGIMSQRIDSGFGGESDDLDDVSEPAEATEDADGSIDDIPITDGDPTTESMIFDKIEDMGDTFDEGFGDLFNRKKVEAEQKKAYSDVNEQKKKVANTHYSGLKKVKDASDQLHALNKENERWNSEIDSKLAELDRRFNSLHESEDDDLMNMSIGEAISIGGDNGDEDDEFISDTPASDEDDGDSNGIVKSGNSNGATKGAPPDEGENEVTSAVRSKVSEMDAAAPDTADGEGVDKEAIMNKLSSLTKSIEDAKTLVMKSI